VQRLVVGKRAEVEIAVAGLEHMVAVHRVAAAEAGKPVVEEHMVVAVVEYQDYPFADIAVVGFVAGYILHYCYSRAHSCLVHLPLSCRSDASSNT